MEKITYRKTLDAHKNGIQFTLQGFETADNMSRVIEISLMASGDTVDIPLEGVVAMMYVTTPNAKEPSINHCTVKNNTIVYDVLPITEEGMTEMQLKLIQSDVNGATKVLISPRFAVEVMGSNADDGDAEQTNTFTALENAVAKAEAVYSKRIDRIDVSPDGIFNIYYADGVVYESDAFLKLIMTEGTDIDLHSLISEGIASFTAEEVAEYLDGRYRDIFAKAEMSTDLFATYSKPTFIQWNSSTANTPYTAGLVSVSSGFALAFGTAVGDHTVIAWSIGDGVHSHIHRYIMGVDVGWDSYITASGGTMAGSLGLGGGKGFVSADNDGAYIEANSKQIKVKSDASLEDAAKVVSVKNSVKTEYNLFGEHNPNKMKDAGYVRIKYGTYTGNGQTTVTIDFNVEPIAFIYRGACVTRDDVKLGIVASWRGYDFLIEFKWGTESLELVFKNDDIENLNDVGKTYGYYILY